MRDNIIVFSIILIVAYVPTFLVSYTETDEYLCTKTIEGHEFCFHTNDGKFISYYEKFAGIHFYIGMVVNSEDGGETTLEDEFEEIAEEHKKINVLKCEQ